MWNGNIHQFFNIVVCFNGGKMKEEEIFKLWMRTSVIFLQGYVCGTFITMCMDRIIGIL